MHIVLLRCQIVFWKFTSCSFEAEIIKIGQSSHKMYSNNILNSQESKIILNALTKKVWKLIVCPSYIPLLHNLTFQIDKLLNIQYWLKGKEKIEIKIIWSFSSLVDFFSPFKFWHPGKKRKKMDNRHNASASFFILLGTDS